MASFLDVAISDMRKPGFVGAYAASYALNDDVWWLRTSSSAFAYHAQLSQGIWPNPYAFDPAYNPDASELAWFNSAPQNQITWSRINSWYDSCLGETYKANHAPGWINNTHVMVWGLELWVKSKATGLWVRKIYDDANVPKYSGGWNDSGNAWYGMFYEYPNDAWKYPETGYMTWRFRYPVDPPYLLVHAYSGEASIDPYDIAAVISFCRASLVVRDPAKADDRDYSRFQLKAGSDYKPDDGRVTVYPGCGASRMKFVRAKWPNWQFHIMHTMTEAQISAPGGCPAELLALSEGGGAVEPPPGPGPGGTTILAPTVGEWQPLLVSGKAAWGASGVTGSPSGKIRRRRGIVLME